MNALTDLLLPRRCPCGDALDDDHAGRRAPAVCPECRRSLTGGAALAARPYPRPAGLPACSAAAAYAGGVRRCLIAYKERRWRSLAPVLALALVKALGGLVPALGAAEPLLLVPVPASRAALRSRGFDHVALLVQSAVRLMPSTIRAQWSWSPLLYPVRRVADQAGLPAAARARNVAGSLALRPGPRRLVAARASRLVLVDDVLTSGATLAEAARALRAGGLRTHNAVVVAAVVRPESAGSSALPSRGRSG
jgi:predicted amidophosphoribosyltransferase